MTTTPLDAALTAMEAAPEDDNARLRFYERLADGELYLLLTKEIDGAQIEPELFDLGDARFVLVFDREERLSQFVGRAAPYAALSGRAVANMLAGQGIGLAVNIEVSEASTLLPPEAVDWLAATLGHGPSESEARIEEVSQPGGLPEALLQALDTKLATAAGFARCAWLAGASYEGGGRGHILAFAGTLPGAEDALARAVNEALVFSGIEAGALDVIFLRDSDELAASLTRVGLRFDLPQIEEPARVERIAPGSDPDSPPILR
ncbi:hypothetical protein AYJ57_06415 [Salipiger sp. CCB-MM3]|uniref:SseB family protein n=1 Tax=Roseobacteraceae TaxID=2854170 RepID=UPI00080A9885|nr:MULTISPECIES: SseB family protein [Roseobacteraceae]ANT60032.1 hypothetical protein AYJ57_06415 [Salipiger sp. CCB-MM3]MCA0995131.1 SseB family protein [Alloyangia pacifica]